MVLEKSHAELVERQMEIARPNPGSLLLKVLACGVCRTDLHLWDGELPDPKFPLVLGHEIVGKVMERGESARRFKVGDRVGVPWLGWTCGECHFCRSGQENLCDRAKFTGYQIDGGYAEFALADERYVFPIPEGYSDVEAAPLLCAGLIGYRSLKMVGDAEKLGIYGFGAAAHLIAQLARAQGRKVFAFTRPKDFRAQKFASDLGVEWVGGSDQGPSELLDGALIFAPLGELVPTALKAVRKGGTVVCGGIHMSDIPRFPYELLWGERVIRSVANLTRKDGEEFFYLVSKTRIHVEAIPFALNEAQTALQKLKAAEINGAAVLIPT
jgi:propanol-preferring alcohol dehydrogenase